MAIDDTESESEQSSEDEESEEVRSIEEEKEDGNLEAIEEV